MNEENKLNSTNAVDDRTASTCSPVFCDKCNAPKRQDGYFYTCGIAVNIAPNYQPEKCKLREALAKIKDCDPESINGTITDWMRSVANDALQYS